MTVHDIKDLKLILALVAMVAVTLWGIRGWLRRRRMGRWMRIGGTVEEVTIKVVRRNLAGDVCYVRFRLAYSVLGKSFVTERFDPQWGTQTMSGRKARRLAAAHAPGTAIDLWVNPADPAEAYARRTSLGVLVLTTFFGPTLLAIVVLLTQGNGRLRGILGDSPDWLIGVTVLVLVCAAIAMVVAAVVEPGSE